MKKLCQFADGKCTQCGEPMASNMRRPCIPGKKWPAMVSAPKPPSTREGLGDWMERKLTSIGVTKERWGEAKALVGLDPSCNCVQRKAWLNSVSDWWRGESG